MTDLASMDATAQAELVRSGEASPPSWSRPRSPGSRQLNPQLNAVIHELFEEARAEAAPASSPTGRSRASRSCSRTSAPRYAGQPLPPGDAGCSRRPTSARRSTPTSAERFRAAGFVTIGKTNTPELGILPTTEPRRLRRRPATPGTPTHTTGGSSRRLGGGGRLRHGRRSRTPTTAAARSGSRPAICGLVGLKPTRQRITEGPLIGDNITGPDRRARASRARSATPPRSSTRSRARRPATPTSPRRPRAPTSRS